MKYLSVCSGIEAVTVAWQPLGWTPVAFAEIDPFCSWLLRSRYGASRPLYMPSPHVADTRQEAKQRAAAIRNVIALPINSAVVNFGDFTQIGKDDVGAIDLLAGGTPCQSFSIAGKRAGLDDPRGNLTLEFARLVDRVRPLWVVWENVPGVLSIDGGRTFGAFLGLLVQLGYGIAYRILNAEYFGVPQRRRRVFVVGCAGDWRAAAAVLLDQSCLSGHPPSRREARQGTAVGVEVGTAGGRFTDTAPTIDAGCKDGFIRNQLGVGVLSSTDEISRCLNAGGMGRQDFETEMLIAHSLSADGFDASEDGTGRGTPMVPIVICTAHTQSNGHGFSDNIAHTLEQTNSQAVAFNLRGREGGAVPEPSPMASIRAASGGSTNSYVAFSAKDYGADVGVIAPTLRGMGHDASHANGGGQVAVAAPLTASYGSPRRLDSSDTNSGPPNLLHSEMAVRRLTPRECERLQGFPDDYTLVEYRGKSAADGPRYRALGNSMAVPVMRWIGERIAAVHEILMHRTEAAPCQR
ncbi:MAG TPA: DNA (cytosine-5-)-methyltransferase [Acidobacteriaceae bacterium]|nr:DNA (cytosine-5-)-methyltransferase [Acidobacteriaceae bacterium]